MSRKPLLADWAWSESTGETFFQSGVLFCKTHEKNCVAQENSCKGNNLKWFEVFKETQMIFHGEEVLNIKLTCEKQTHDTALRMCVHNPDMLLAHSLGCSEHNYYKLAYR